MKKTDRVLSESKIYRGNYSPCKGHNHYWHNVEGYWECKRCKIGSLDGKLSNACNHAHIWKDTNKRTIKSKILKCTNCGIEEEETKIFGENKGS